MAENRPWGTGCATSATGILIASGLLLIVHLSDSSLVPSACNSKTACGECIRSSGCSWCAQPIYGPEQSRCFNQLAEDRPSCLLNHLVNPQNRVELIQDRPLTRQLNSSSSTSGPEEVTQIRPQNLKLKLRLNQKERISLVYAKANDYPVDLYYLMDMSLSMNRSKNTLSKLGNNLAEEMRKITRNFRLGFGSFVDKNLLPYTSLVPHHRCDPSSCTSPYGFRNVMPLNINTSEFSQKVRDTKISYNQDYPEGGLDAIMQAIVCKKEIGWRNASRRLLLVSTDSDFHIAGDGRLGGVITPNDGKCHLDSNGMYTHSTLLDYPSIGHINHTAKEHSVNIIFAVTSNQKKLYEELSANVLGSSCAELHANAGNVVDLVKAEYNKITSSIELKDNATSDIRITYHSACRNRGGDLKQTSVCGDLRDSDFIEFHVDIEATKCPDRRDDWKRIVQIYPVGLAETTIIELQLECDCGCSEKEIPAAEECSRNGRYSCGICQCDQPYSGERCECSLNNEHTDPSRWGSCRADNTSTIDCNGRGSCVCGQCQCVQRENSDEQFQGKYCECDNFSCLMAGGQLCSGPEHGICDCNRCRCAAGWTGAACDCRDTVDTCVPPQGGELCGGHGQCKCGACECTDRYSGEYCESCPTCQDRCTELRDCVQCQMYQTGPLAAGSGEACQANCTFLTVGVDAVAVEKPHERLCTFSTDTTDCRYQFVYADDLSVGGGLRVRANVEADCPHQLLSAGAIFGIAGTVVLVGLATLLLWKVLTTIHDRKEYMRFEKERSTAKWDQGGNPIYKQATSTFANPTFAGK